MSSAAGADADLRTETAGEEIETIDLSDVADLSGRLGERAVVDIALDDGRVVTALVDAVRQGEHVCPADGCLRRFETDHGLNVHLGRVHSDAEGRTCPECGDGFHTPPSNDDTYCSRECYVASRTTTTTCGTCGVAFEHKTSRDATFCSNTCRYEGRRTEPRPDDVHDLLYELYAEEDKDRETTVERALAVLGVDSEWSAGALDTEIDTAIIQTEIDLPDRITAERVRDLAEDAETRLEVQNELRINRQRTRRVLSRLGLDDEVDADEDDLLAAARDNLGLDEDGNPVDVPESGSGADWSAYSGRGGAR